MTGDLQPASVERATGHAATIAQLESWLRSLERQRTRPADGRLEPLNFQYIRWFDHSLPACYNAALLNCRQEHRQLL
jgi:hypothetical protein